MIEKHGNAPLGAGLVYGHRPEREKGSDVRGVQGGAPGRTVVSWDRGIVVIGGGDTDTWSSHRKLVG